MATKMATFLKITITFCTLLHLVASLKHSVSYPNKGPNSLKPRISHEREDDNSEPLKMVCYYGSWAVYRPGQGKFPVEEIDPFLCSHIVYGFAGLGSDGRIRALDPYNDLKDNWGKGAFQRFTGLKSVNPKLKSLIAIGGWNEGSVKYSNMAAGTESRAVFVQSVVDFLDRYGFEGLDMDWEYPASRGGKPEDKRNFVLLLKELKEAFRPKGYLLTAAVSAGKYFADPAYDIPQVSKYLDIISVMTYDYHGGWETKTGHNAPLYARPDEYGNDRILNVNYSINYWISNGAPRSKIVLGLGSYGRSFTLSRADVNGLGAPAPQKGQAGPYTREGGSLGYNEICEMQQRDPASMTIVWDRHHLAPYAYWGRQWVGYDNVRSISLKAAYARAMGLGGAMLWSLETDDFAGRCGGGRYPLLNAVKRVLAMEEVPPLPLPGAGEEEEGSSTSTSTSRRPTSTTSTTTTRRPTTTTTTTTTTERPTTTTTRRTTTTSERPSSTTSTSTTYRPETEPTTTTTTTSTTTRRPSSSTTSTTTTTTEDSYPSSSTSTSTTINWWPHRSSTWWPQKSSTWWPQNSQTAASEVWWSSTTPSPGSTSSKEPENPNSIGETPKPPTDSTTETKKKKEFICTESGLFRSPDSCTAFIRCLETAVEGQFQLFFHQCPDRTVFNSDSRLCDWAENVPECLDSVPRYFLRGTFQTNFHVVHGEGGSGNGGEREGASSA